MAQPSILTPGAKVGKYEVVEVIGFGGMGLVYKVREQVGAVSRIRALKTVLPQFASDAGVMARFRQEAEKMCMLEHENIVPVLSYSEEGEFPYLVMPFIEGQTLKDYLVSHVTKEGRGLPLAEVMEIGLEVARGLEVAHGFVNPETKRPAPMIHRDIKPGNVMIRVEELGSERRIRILIMDFGIAKVLSGQDSGHTLTEVIGTVKYAAPEQVRRGRDIDPRADIYSLGMVLYELYAGKHMFSGLPEHNVLMRMMQRDVQDHEITFPEDAPERFRQLIRRSVAVDRERRTSSIAEMRALMRRILEEDSERITADVDGARRSAAAERTQALGAAADRYAPNPLAEADALFAEGEAAEAQGQLRKALGAFRAAAERFDLARVEAAHGRERERLSSGCSALGVRRAAAVAAEVDRLVPDAFARADQATTAAGAALEADDLSRGVRSLSEAESAWQDAEDLAAAERGRIEAARECDRFEAAVAAEREAISRLPAHLRAGSESEIAELSAATQSARAAAASGDVRTVSRIAAEGLAQLERMSIRRQASLAAALKDLSTALSRRLAEIGSSPDRSLVADEHEELTAAADAAQEHAAREGGATAIAELERVMAAVDRVEARLTERAAERDRRLAIEERNRRAAPGAARALAALGEARAEISSGPPPRGAEESELREIETVATIGERHHRAGELAEALPYLQQAAERLLTLVEEIAARGERERLESHLSDLRLQATAESQQLVSLGSDSRASEVERRLLAEFAAAETETGRGNLADAIRILEAALPAMQRHVADRRAALEEARREAEVRAREKRATEAKARAEERGPRATRAAAFSTAEKQVAEGEQALRARDFAAAGASFESATRSLEELVTEIDRLSRAERLQSLASRRDAVGRAIEQLPPARYLARRKKAVTRSFVDASGAIARGDEESAARLLDEIERASRDLAEEAERRATEPQRETPWGTIGASIGAIVAIAVAVVWFLTRPTTGSPPVASITPRPHVEPTAYPTSPRRSETAVPAPPPRTAVPERPTVVPVEPTALPRPTTAPSPPPTVREPAVAAPAPLALASARPAAQSIRIPASSETRFEASLKESAGASLEWKLGGKPVGTGRSFVLDDDRTATPATTTIEVLAARGTERVSLRTWTVVIEPPPLGFARLEPASATVERTSGVAVGLRAPIRNAEGQKLAFTWLVNGDAALGANGPSFDFRAERPGEYTVQVRATAPWGASISNSWRIRVKPPPKPSIVEEVKKQPPPAGDPHGEAQEWISAYCGAFQSKDTSALIALGHLSSQSEAARLRDALETMKDLKVSCSNSSVRVSGDQAVVSFDRTDRWIDPRGTEMERALPRITKTLHRANGRWVATP